jgi:hypothetical protein
MHDGLWLYCLYPSHKAKRHGTHAMTVILFALCSASLFTIIFTYLFPVLYHLKIGAFWTWAKKHPKKFFESVTIASSVMFILMSLLLSAMIFSLFDTAYNRAFSESKDYIYMGSSDDGHHYIDSTSPSSPLLLRSARTYNGSFHSLLRPHTFATTAKNGYLGEKVTQTQFFYILSRLAFILMTATIVLSFLHTSVSGAVIQIHNVQEYGQLISRGDYFDQVSANIGLSKQSATLLGLGSMFAAMILSLVAMNVHRSESRAPFYSLPLDIKAGNTIHARPLSINPLIEQKTERDISGRNSYSSVDTGKRFLTVVYEKGMPSPVYLSLLMHKNEIPGWVEKTEQAISSNTDLSFELTENLSLKLLE